MLDRGEVRLGESEDEQLLVRGLVRRDVFAERVLSVEHRLVRKKAGLDEGLGTFEHVLIDVDLDFGLQIVALCGGQVGGFDHAERVGPPGSPGPMTVAPTRRADVDDPAGELGVHVRDGFEIDARAPGEHQGDWRVADLNDRGLERHRRRGLVAHGDLVSVDTVRSGLGVG